MSDAQFAELERVCPGVSRETFLRLKAFETLFIQWGHRINLVAESTLPHIWTRHIVDSAQLFTLGGPAVRWLDIGSGGGFPGLVLAFLLQQRSNSAIDLVESNQKKAAFLRTVTGRFALPCRVNVARIETFVPGSTPQVVTARALASLPQLLILTERWLCNGAIGLFPKGREYRRELEDCAHLWRFDLLEHPSATDSEGIILEIANLTRR